MSFDTDKFISEIQSRKAIWDLQSEEYANRDLKKKQWEEIVELFGGEELSDEEKKTQVIESQSFQEEQDEDRMFLMSLLSSFRAIPEHKKSAAKIQLISVIESFRSSTQNNIYPNTMWRNFNEYEYERGYFTPEAGRSTAPSQQSRPEAQHYYTLPTSTPSERERPESRFSTVTSNTSQDSDILDLF
ncbi:unnamed protein product [Parnassius mnemosyne]|uniref:MADF domain-containing protein n=1 Tax=Parnassius mnemosyne TaxID=213953 RepID=A0AAV1LB59_9NEOP